MAAGYAKRAHGLQDADSGRMLLYGIKANCLITITYVSTVLVKLEGLITSLAVDSIV